MTDDCIIIIGEHAATLSCTLDERRFYEEPAFFAIL